MSNERQLVPVDSNPALTADPFITAPAPEEDPALILRRFHNMMRGRYIWAIAAAVLLGGLGAAAGYFSQDPIYRSTGVIRIEPNMPKLIYTIEDNSMLPMFEAFVGSQVVFIQSQRVVLSALENDSWRSLGRGTSTQVLEEFTENLNVTHPPRSELIIVSYTDEDRNAAKAAVKSIIESYNKIFVERGLNEAADRLNRLEVRRTTLQDEVDALLDRRTTLTDDLGTADVAGLAAGKIADLTDYEDQLTWAELQLAAMTATSNGGNQDPDNPDGAEPNPDGANPPSPQPPVIDRSAVTNEQLATTSQDMAQILEAIKAQERQIQLLVDGQGLGRGHRSVKLAERQLKVYVSERDRLRDELLAVWAGGLVPGLPGAGAESEAALRQRILLLKNAVRLKEADVASLGKLNVQVRQLDSDIRRKGQLLADTVTRLEKLTTEAAAGGRVKIISSGEDPIRPWKDNRLKFAVLGGGFGVALGGGLLVLIALLDRRLRNIFDAQDRFGDVTMLGILPRLPDDLADPDQAAMASHCVHQIRTLLQIGSDVQGRRVITVTSPASQDGKTSLTLALGLSFSASGSKTLVIDCDLAGGGLSARVNAIIRRKIGQILLRQQIVTEQQIEQALRVAQESDQRLGEALVDLGFVKAEEIDKALDLQEQMRVGLLDVIEGDALENCIADTGIPGLSVLPVGRADASDVAKISPTAVREVLDEARSQFDIVLIDTGPVPGSLEASQVAAEADGVIMVVSRGEQRDSAERALEHLAAIGARVSGLVFNRAEGWDVRAVSQSVSVSMSGQWDDVERSSGRYNYRVNEKNESSRFGPVARAVASTSANDRDEAGNEKSNGSSD